MFAEPAIDKSMSEQHRTLIVGLGKTGMSCARFLAAQGIALAVTDSRNQPPELECLQQELPDVAIFTGGFDANAFAAADQIIVSPGVSLREPLIADAIDRGVPVLGDIELFARYVDGPVIAVTGSNGKSTVTALVGEIAEQAGLDVRVGGNIGTPALDLLEKNKAHDIQHGGPPLYVLELSSFQLETTWSLKPTAAVVLNISLDHMDRYTDLSAYAQAKQRIYQGGGAMIVNLDDPVVVGMVEKGRDFTGFTLDEPQEGQFGLRRKDHQLWLAKGEQCLLSCEDVRIKGRHNLANALAALALGEAVNIPMPDMLRTLRVFPGLPHRMQWVGEKDGVAFYNDSKGTNVGATLAALQGMSGKTVLIAGGIGKGADFTVLRATVEEKARAVVLIGQDAPLLEKALGGMVNIVHAKNMEEAVGKAFEMSHAGDNVLLSPACASFDMFNSYAERGAAFVAVVRKLVS
jgi:UDP-N-acetylmuramoylalanine--D-glutamate ligase